MIMKDNRKCITISLQASIWNHCLVGIEENLGGVYQCHTVTRGNFFLQLATQIWVKKIFRAPVEL